MMKKLLLIFALLITVLNTASANLIKDPSMVDFNERTSVLSYLLKQNNVNKSNQDWFFDGTCDDNNPPIHDPFPPTPYELCLIQNPGCSCNGSGTVIYCQWQ